MFAFKILNLKAYNFRNLSAEIITFSEKINCIFGDNGNGKTNILEAISILATKKSFRKKTTFSQYLSLDADSSEVILQATLINLEKEKKSISIKINNEGMTRFFDNELIKKNFDIPLVFINPFDSHKFFNEPSFRREWFDNYISQLNDRYKKELNRYQKFLKQRNRLLAEKPKYHIEQIKAMDIEIAKSAIYITSERFNYINIIKQHTLEIYKKIFSVNHDLTIELETKVISYTEQQYIELMASRLEKDLVRCRTSYGIHIDDFILYFDGLNAFDYCSLGQQKMSYLSLLFGHVELFRCKFLAYPIVLIDDISGELDRFRWEQLVCFLNESHFQVLITTANDKFKKELERVEDSHRIFVTEGSISYK